MNTKKFVLAFLLASSVQAATLEQQIDAYTKPFRDMNAFSGVIYAARGDKAVFAKAYGMANYEHNVPNTVDTRFAIASITKPFTGIILRRLEEEGKLSKADKLAKWVPDFPNANEITIDQLATHKSGIRDPQKLRGIIRRSFTSAEVVEKLKTEPQESKDYSYTTANYAILGHIIERVTGKSYAEVVKQYVYDPAKMRDSGELATTTVVPRLANGYAPNPFGPGVAVCGPEDTSWKIAGGSSYSTAADLHRFARWNRARPTNSTMHEKPVVSLSGGFPGASANLLYFPAEEVTVVVLSNNYANIPFVITEAVAGMLFGKKYEPPVVKVAANPYDAPPHAAGVYGIVDRPWTFTLRFREGKPYIAWSEIRQGALLRVSEDTWFEPFDWGLLKLKFDEAGKFVDGSFQFGNQEPLKVVRK
jgi:CubicO group peptidase (beta-lactamase class C family)